MSLSPSQVNKVRFEIFATDSTQSDIAANWGVSRKTVYNIANNKRYANVPLNTIPEYSNYTIYPTGKIVSNKTRSVLTPVKGAVRLYDNKGNRKSEPVATLLNRAIRRAKRG